MKTRRIHEYPADYYRDQAEFDACRRIARAHAVVAWIVAAVVLAGFACLALSVLALFAG